MYVLNKGSTSYEIYFVYLGYLFPKNKGRYKEYILCLQQNYIALCYIILYYSVIHTKNKYLLKLSNTMYLLCYYLYVNMYLLLLKMKMKIFN